MEADDSIEHLNIEIRAAQKLPVRVDQIRLIFKGKELEDGRTLLKTTKSGMEQQ